jgi:peptidyl-prolyl cis-trans isomerase C
MENKILATVNGREITEKELQETLSKFPKERQGYLLSDEGKKQLLEQVISFELINCYASENGMEEDKEYKMQLEKLKKEILTQATIKKILSEVTVTDDEVQKYYEANQETFKDEESLTAKHILVDSFEQATNVLQNIKDGMAFEEAASKYSSCPSKEQGGNLGSFTRGRMVPEFEKAAFELEVGVVSEPVQTQFGYHLIKVEEKSEAAVKAFDEVKATIKAELLNERQGFKYMQFVEGLKTKYKVEIK